MAQIIKKHNKTISSEKRSTEPKCNCRNKDTCPLNGNCLATNLIYQATIKSPTNQEKIYIGLTEGTWKQRHYNHKLSFNHKKYAHNTALSKYVWNTKDKHNQTPEICWSIKKTAPAYSNKSKRCLLCLQEKMAIINFPEEDKLLNKKSELISKCRHQNKFLLRNYDGCD